MPSKGWLVLLGVLSAGAGAYAALGPGSHATVPPEPDPAAPALVVASKDDTPPPSLASGAELAEERRRQALLREQEEWERVKALFAQGNTADALAAAARLKRTDPAFLADKDRAALLARIDAAALAADRAKRLQESLAAARLTDEQRAALGQQLASSAEILARAANEQDLDQLTRHLRRFLLPDAPGTGGGKDDADQVLRAFIQDRRTRHSKDTSPPVANADEAEKRRIDELEKLRQRDAVGLLDSIHAGLAWLALHQKDDGSISDQSVIDRCAVLKHDPNCLGDTRSVGDVYQVATTGLATIAFLDFRDQDPHGWFDPYLGRAIDFLKKAQKPDGSWGGSGQHYTSAIALMALGQAAASTGADDLKDAVRKGLAYFAGAIGPMGGWRYGRNDPGDLSVTGWVAQAIEAARNAGIDVPPVLANSMGIFLRYVWMGDHRFTYVTNARGPSPSLMPVGMLVGHLAGTDKDDPAAVADWKQALATWPLKNQPNLYTLYYGVRVSILLTGTLEDPWRTWTFNLASRQIHGNSAAGSFPGDMWQYPSGRTVQTAVAVLTLEHSLYLR